MGEVRWKPIVFAATVMVAIILITVLVVHRSSTRSSLCENSGDLFYKEDLSGGSDNGTCYPMHKQGPCPNNMILIPDINQRSLGVCDCDSTERSLEYDEATNQCYFIFTQGYCRNEREWLVKVNSSTTPISCEPNPCFFNNGKGSEWVMLKDRTCVELGKPHPSCKEGEVIRFFKYKLYPACNYSRKPPIEFAQGGVGVPPAECPKDQSRTKLGHCAPYFDFD